jgi:hypothetical protein
LCGSSLTISSNLPAVSIAYPEDACIYACVSGLMALSLPRSALPVTRPFYWISSAVISRPFMITVTHFHVDTTINHSKITAVVECISHLSVLLCIRPAIVSERRITRIDSKLTGNLGLSSHERQFAPQKSALIIRQRQTSKWRVEHACMHALALLLIKLIVIE